ncbi:MAG TPA: aldo/keto reductase [Polyangia bacterium]|nr:aldo/keto reductase [Polyangia bacterium]
MAAPAAPILTRKIPRSGEPLPAVGLGTWQTFDVGEGAAERAPLSEVLRRLAAGGGKLVDSSPMYGRAESVVGDLASAAALRDRLFLATKVWTTGRAAGEAQMQESMRRLHAGDRLDLMQIHNLLDWQTHLPVLRRWKEQGRFRYIGITHYQLSAFGEIERLLRTEKLDFVQLPYSIGVREAERRLLPAAAETGTAVIVMRPFEAGALFGKIRSTPLPPWAAELDARSWAQFFLKFILAHPAVTCAIPATNKPEHAVDNLGAALGRLPAEAQRRKMIEWLNLG